MMRRNLKLLCLCLALALLLGLAGMRPSAAAEETSFPLEVPVLDDLPEIDVDDWSLLLANSYNSISFEFALETYGSFDGQGLDPRIAEATQAMLDGAHDAGYTVYVSVAYRNGEYLFTHYQNAILKYGSAAEAAANFLPPGCNDHQTGLAVDITLNPMYRAFYGEFEDEDVKADPVYDWMVEHCAEYGFILRYPEGKEAWYGTPCHHAHFRYVGEEIAQYITEHDLCLEEFLYLEDPTCLFVPGLNTYASH